MRFHTLRRCLMHAHDEMMTPALHGSVCNIQAFARDGHKHDNQYIKCPAFILLGYFPTTSMLAIYFQNGVLVHHRCKFYSGAPKSKFGS